MFAKLLLFSLFAVCQAAQNEPWWIRMFFPNVSFTGKYHPSNYKVEKSPLFPDYVQNSNDVWSPAYWMPYKLAYSQYWIDFIDNVTKAEQEKAKEISTQAAQQWSGYQSGHIGQNGYYGTSGQYNQYEMGGQYSQNEQYESNTVSQGQILIQEASSLANQVRTQAERMKREAQQIVSQGKQEAEKQMQAVVEEANQKKQKVAGEAQLISKQAEKVSAEIDQTVEAKVKAIKENLKVENMNQNAEKVKQEAENQIKAVIEKATEKKQEIAAEVDFISGQAEKISALIDKAAEAEVETIAQEINQFELDMEKQFAPLYDEAKEIVLEAAQIAENIKSHEFQA